MESRIIIPGFWPRVWALLIDSFILGVAGFLLGWIAQDFFVGTGKYGVLVGLTIAVAYQAIFNSKLGNGQTPGKRLMYLQVVSGNGDTIGPGKSLWRAIILSFPYFTINLLLPVEPSFSFANAVKTLVLGSVVIGVVIIYIFNRSTRQSLHDLLVGTYVASTLRLKEPALIPALTRTPFRVYAGMILLLISVALATGQWKSGSLENIYTIYSKISQLDGVVNESVLDKTMHAGGATRRVYQIELWVRHLPKEGVENDTIARKAVQILLNDAKDIDDFDEISVSMVRGFDIGIARQKSAITLRQPPVRWKEVIQSTRIITRL